MLLNIAMAVLASFVVMYATASVFRAVGFKGWATFVGQLVTVGILSFLLFQLSFIPQLAAGGLIAVVVGTRGLALVWLWYIGKKLLDGSYGEESMWAAQLAKEDDTEFLQATEALSQPEMREIGVIADSKEELRELTIERFEK